MSRFRATYFRLDLAVVSCCSVNVNAEFYYVVINSIHNLTTSTSSYFIMFFDFTVLVHFVFFVLFYLYLLNGNFVSSIQIVHFQSFNSIIVYCTVDIKTQMNGNLIKCVVCSIDFRLSPFPQEYFKKVKWATDPADGLRKWCLAVYDSSNQHRKELFPDHTHMLKHNITILNMIFLARVTIKL